MSLMPSPDNLPSASIAWPKSLTIVAGILPFSSCLASDVFQLNFHFSFMNRSSKHSACSLVTALLFLTLCSSNLPLAQQQKKRQSPVSTLVHHSVQLTKSRSNDTQYTSNNSVSLKHIGSTTSMPHIFRQLNN